MVASNKVRRRRRKGKRKRKYGGKLKRGKRRKLAVRRRHKRAPRRHKKVKSGPKSFRTLSVMPPKLGFNAQIAWRHNQMMSSATMDAYRSGFRCMWKYNAPNMTRWKIGKPDSFNKKNQHGGVMWSLPSECKGMTGLRAGIILKECAKYVSISKLNQVRKSLSYAFFLTTGIGKSNWPQVKSVHEQVTSINWPRDEIDANWEHGSCHYETLSIPKH